MILRKLTCDHHPQGVIVKDMLEPGRIVVVDRAAWLERVTNAAMVVFEKRLSQCDRFERGQAMHDACAGYLGDLP